MPTRTVQGMGTRSRTTAQGVTARDRRDRGDVVHGTVLEMSGEPYRQTVSAWRINAGQINGVDVSGQVVLVISGRPGRALEGRCTGIVLLDERASPEQVLALLDAFRGRLGGHLAEFAGTGVDDRGFCQVPIASSIAGERVDISVPDRLRLVIHLDRLVASEVSVAIPEHGLGWLAQDVPVSSRDIRIDASLEEEACPG
jgi:hypothetical protein